MAVKVMLAQMREKRGVSQNALAKAVGMSLQGVQHIEYKARSINLETLEKLCLALDCEPGDLLKLVPDSLSTES